MIDLYEHCPRLIVISSEVFLLRKCCFPGSMLDAAATSDTEESVASSSHFHHIWAYILFRYALRCEAVRGRSGC